MFQKKKKRLNHKLPISSNLDQWLSVTHEARGSLKHPAMYMTDPTSKE